MPCDVNSSSVLWNHFNIFWSCSWNPCPPPPPSPLKDPPMDYIYTTLTRGSRPHTQEECHVMLTAVLFCGITSISSGGALETPVPPPPSPLKDPPMDFIYTTLTKGSRPHTQEGCHVMLTAVLFSGITSISSGGALGTPAPPPLPLLRIHPWTIYIQHSPRVQGPIHRKDAM